jgi:signal transduction histidine kinase
VTWQSRWRADLTHSGRTTIDRRELPVLLAGATIIVVVAQITDPGSPVELALVIAAATGFVLSAAVDRIPSAVVAVLVTALLATAMWRHGNLEVALFIPVLTTLYAAWHLNSLTKTLVITAAAAAAPLVVSTAIPEEEIAWTPWAAANVVMFVLGRNLRRQRALITQLEAAREALAQQAVANERQHIARELHDLAGHTLAAVLLHVTGARHVLRRDLDEAERALLQAETVGRGSLEQIRFTVASLRIREREWDPALPGSADLVGLVEEYRRAGLEVRALVAGPAAGIDGPVGTALHRIGREALANVARHAPGNRVEFAVDLDATTGEVRLVVADHGRAPAGQGHDEGHFGLVGMRERARALGGDLDAGPTADGWRIEARLPLAAAGRERSLP